MRYATDFQKIAFMKHLQEFRFPPGMGEVDIKWILKNNNNIIWDYLTQDTITAYIKNPNLLVIHKKRGKRR